MTPPPTESTEHEREPCLMHNLLRSLEPNSSHILDYERQVVEVQVSPFHHQISMAVIIARFALLDLLPPVDPIVHSVRNVRCHQIYVMQLIHLFDSLKVFCRPIPTIMYFFEEVQIGTVDFIQIICISFPFAVSRRQLLILLQDPGRLLGKHIIGLCAQVFFESAAEYHKTLFPR